MTSYSIVNFKSATVEIMRFAKEIIHHLNIIISNKALYLGSSKNTVIE